MVLHHSLTVGELVAFFLYFNRFFQPIQMLVQQYTVYQQSQSSILKLRMLLAEEPAVQEAVDAVDLPSVAGEIRFEGVSFGYSPDSPVLQGIDLTISPGETVAFVGPTGAGKSTAAKLVMRFYDATEGRVLVDGHDVRDVTLSSLRRQVGLVPQEAFLFAGSLRDNIAFGRPSASDAEVTQAVAAVGLTGLVDRLPEGLDTEVHERGQSLSAGERQLVALARAFLAQPHVLVLDEATANLDLQSETEVEHALDALLQERTAILIAHRLTTAMKSDRIVVIEDGRIAESGSPDELLSEGGRFAQMYDAWIEHAGDRTVSEPLASA
jgi:ATP-binding cassette subfamily B protein